MRGNGRGTTIAVLATCGVVALCLVWVAARLIVDGVGRWPAKADRAPARSAMRAERGGDAPLMAPATAPALPPTDPARASSGLRGNPGQFFGPDAYPAEAIRAGEQGRTVAALTIDAAGLPTACAVETSSGSRSLDSATCAIAMGRVRFDPARDEEGRPIASHYRLPVRWVLPR